MSTEGTFEERCQKECITVEWLMGSWGRIVGKHPGKVCGSSFIFIIFLCCGWAFYKWNDDDFALVWTEDGSRVQDEYKIRRDSYNTSWDQVYGTALFMNKNDDTDVINPESFGEIFAIYNETSRLVVTTESGLAYDMHDLCFRGIRPDNPALPRFPCFHVTPLMCFGELAETLDPVFQMADAAGLIAAGLTAAGQTPATAFASRPLFTGTTAADMKAVLSTQRTPPGYVPLKRGCNWVTATQIFENEFMGAKPEWTADGMMIKQSAIVVLYYFDEPVRAAFRMNITKPTHAIDSEISEARDKMQDAVEEVINRHHDNAQHIQAAFLKINFFKAVMEENSEVPFVPVIISFILIIFVFLSITTNFWRPSRSHAGLAMAALFCLLLSLIASGGAMGWIILRWNVTMVQCLPFLAIGLGGNDMLVLFLCLGEFGAAKVKELGPEETIVEILTHAGVGVTLSSVALIVAFGLCALIPVAGVADFCLGASVVAFVNYVIVMTFFTSLLTMDAGRLARGAADPSPCTIGCHSGPCKPQDGELDKEGWGSGFRNCLEKTIAPVLINKIVAACLLVVSVAYLIVCVMQISGMELGIHIPDLVREDSPSYLGLNIWADHVSTWTSYFYYHNLDWPNNQMNVINMVSNLYASKVTDPKMSAVTAGTFCPFLYIFYVIFVANANLVPCSAGGTMADCGFTFNATAQGTHPSFAPAGVANPDYFTSMFTMYRTVPFACMASPAAAASAQCQALLGSPFYFYADYTGTNTFTYGSDGSIQFANDKWYAIGLTKTDEIMDFINGVRDIIEASPISDYAFPYGSLFTYFDVYDGLWGVFWQTFGIVLAVVFVLHMFFLRAIRAALASTIIVALIVVEIFGTAVMVPDFIQFNFITAAALLMGLGISVDFVVHMVCNFSLSKGSAQQKMVEAMRFVGPAVLLGGLTTIIALIPMGFSPLPFTKKYFFGLFMIICAFGLFNGLIVLPAFLGLMHCGSPENGKEVYV